jgi:hypothetical protein
MIASLPHGTRFNIVVSAVAVDEPDDCKVYECWKPEMTPANLASVQDAVDWTLRFPRDKSNHLDANRTGSVYSHLAGALSFSPDRIVSFDTMHTTHAYGNRYRQGFSHDEKKSWTPSHLEEIKRYANDHEDAHFRQLKIWDHRLIEAALNPLVLAGPQRDGRRPTAMCWEIPKPNNDSDVGAARRWANITAGYVNIWDHDCR